MSNVYIDKLNEILAAGLTGPQGPPGPQGNGIQRGSAFPTSPSQHDLYQRTDLGVIAEYDGARWLGRIEPITLQQWSSGANPFSAAGTLFSVPINASFTIRELIYGAQVNTANNASNYWSLAFSYDSTTINTLTTAAMSASAYNNLVWAPAPPATYTAARLNVAASKVGAPGPLFITVSLRIRRVYT
jgi:hypothetical protein